MSEAPSRHQRSPSRSSRELCAAGMMLFFIAALVAVMLWATKGDFNKGYGVAFFVCVALFAGIGFWAFTPSEDTSNTFKAYGIRLAGGAAVGLTFASIAWRIVADQPQSAMVLLPPEVKIEGLNATSGPGVSSSEIFRSRDRAVLYVAFRDGARKGEVTLRWFDIGSPTASRQRRIVVDREGHFSE